MKLPVEQQLEDAMQEMKHKLPTINTLVRTSAANKNSAGTCTAPTVMRSAGQPAPVPSRKVLIQPMQGITMSGTQGAGFGRLSCSIRVVI
jgi:hypothetical protein